MNYDFKRQIIEKTKIDIAVKMLSKNYDINEIAELTDLETSKIENLSNKSNKNPLEIDYTNPNWEIDFDADVKRNKILKAKNLLDLFDVNEIHDVDVIKYISKLSGFSLYELSKINNISMEFIQDIWRKSTQDINDIYEDIVFS